MTEGSGKKEGIRPVGSTTIKYIPEDHISFGDGETYVLCGVCHKKLSIGTMAEHYKVSGASVSDTGRMRCLECYDLIYGGASVRTPEEQENYMKTSKYLEAVELRRKADQRTEERIKKEKIRQQSVSEDIFREVLNLRYVHNQSYSDIAKKLNRKLSTVRTWCTGGIVRHRHIYSELMEKYGRI